MREIFDNIINWLKEHNRDIVLNRLSLNTTDDSYDRIFKETGLKIPKDLVKLYSICQGTKWIKGDILNDIHFFPGFYFVSIEESIIMYNNYKDDQRWDVNWFPIFANGGGDFYCVDCSDFYKSPIIEFMLDYDVEQVHESITNMLKTIDKCYKESIYYVDDKNYLEISDYHKEIILRKKINGYT